ncbi:hypothetical protein [Streptomyces sp. NPDC002785]
MHRTDACKTYGKRPLPVRPDGCLGRAGEDASGLARYPAPLDVAAVTRC